MVKIDIGLSMLHYLGEPFSSLCKRLQCVPVRHIELVDDGWHTLRQERVRELKEIGDSQDLAFTLHAPFASINIAAQAQESRNFFLRRLEKSMSFAQRLNCYLMVFHPGWRTGISSFYPGLDWKTNIKSVRKLLELSKKYDVNLLLENCPEPYGFLVKNVEQFSRFFTELGENIKLALDVGHSNINGQTRRFITAFGKKIAHIHTQLSEVIGRIGKSVRQLTPAGLKTNGALFVISGIDCTRTGANQKNHLSKTVGSQTQIPFCECV